MGELRHGRTCVFNINYHIVWSTKYRRKVLNTDIEKRLKGTEHEFKSNALINIINRYNGGQFNPNSLPNNSSFFMSKNLKYGEKVYRINLWDTAGQEK